MTVSPGVVRRRVSANRGVAALNGLAATVRHLRASAGLTLRQLSERCSISTATLSKIERGELSPTYEKIAALAKGLAVDVGALFMTEVTPAPLGRRSVSFKGTGVIHETPQYTYEALNADIASKKFVPLVTTIKAHSVAEFPEMIRHEGEEFIYILKGAVVLHTEYYAPLELSQGDSCYFDSTMGHVCVSSGKESAQVLWVSSNPGSL